MRVACFRAHNQSQGQISIGVIEGSRITSLDLPVSDQGVARFSQDVLSGAQRLESYDFDDIELLQPVLRPPRIFGIGLNYRDHAAETGREPPAVQTWFMKQTTAANAPYGIVHKPCVSDMLDFEAELVVVIGKTCRHVPADRANEVIAGYCVGCDYSVRDWQKATPTMIMGKGFDTHAPYGPWMTTPDEIRDFDNLGVKCWVNGRLMQNGKAGDMIFTVSQMIAHLTAAMTLLPGDIIFTGTPAGVGVARTPPVFMKEGDVVRCAVDQLGHIEQVIENEIMATVIV
jgi:2-keto-4-pentenoate hydratase/2-oxohepta-3-ene-1,7-dioic acid hydratase in catechol pathway